MIQRKDAAIISHPSVNQYKKAGPREGARIIPEKSFLIKRNHNMNNRYGDLYLTEVSDPSSYKIDFIFRARNLPAVPAGIAPVVLRDRGFMRQVTSSDSFQKCVLHTSKNLDEIVKYANREYGLFLDPGKF